MYTVLKATGYDVSEDEFPENVPVSTPYITYSHSDTDNFVADCRVFKKVQNFDVFLHTDGKRRNHVAQSTLETVLDNAEVIYDETDAYYDEQEGHYIVRYEVSEWRE